MLQWAPLTLEGHGLWSHGPCSSNTFGLDPDQHLDPRLNTFHIRHMGGGFSMNTKMLLLRTHNEPHHKNCLITVNKPYTMQVQAMLR